MYNRTMEDLIEAIKNARKNNVKINFLIGAGFSASAGIPLANGLTKIIKSNYENEYKYLEEDNYSSCMGVITGTERKKLISDCVNDAKINWAHLMLAQLVKTNYVNSVLTTNFDNLLLRACAMVNCFPGVYDLVATNGEFREELLFSNSIIHLHGQHTGFLLCNTKKELSNQVNNVEKVFTQLNKNCMWIIVGYSGGSDTIVELFKKHKNSDNRLFWIGYNDEKLNNDLEESFMNKEKYCFYIGGYDADKFMIELVKQLKLDPPDIVKKPFSYLETMVNEIADYKSDEELPFLPSKSRIVTMNSLVKRAIEMFEKDNKLMAEYYRDLDLIDKIEEYLSISDKERSEIEEIKKGNIKAEELKVQLTKFISSISGIITVDRYRDIYITLMFIEVLPEYYRKELYQLLIDKLQKDYTKPNFEIDSLLIKAYIRIFIEDNKVEYLEKANKIILKTNESYYNENRNNIINDQISLLKLLGKYNVDNFKKIKAIENYDEILRILNKNSDKIENYHSLKTKTLIKKIFVDIEKNYILVPELNECVRNYIDYLPNMKKLKTRDNIFTYLIELELVLNKNSEYKVLNSLLEYTTLYNQKVHKDIKLTLLVLISYVEMARGIMLDKYDNFEKEFINKQLEYIVDNFEFNNVDEKYKFDISTTINEISYALIKSQELSLGMKFIKKSLNINEAFFNICTYGLALLYSEKDIKKFEEMYKRGEELAGTKFDADAIVQSKFLELGEYEYNINSDSETAIKYLDLGIDLGEIEEWEHVLMKLTALKIKILKEKKGEELVDNNESVLQEIDSKDIDKKEVNNQEVNEKNIINS